MEATYIYFVVITAVLQSSFVEPLLEGYDSLSLPANVSVLPGSSLNPNAAKGKAYCREAAAVIFNEIIRCLPTTTNTSTSPDPGIPEFANAANEKYMFFMDAFLDQAHNVAPEADSSIEVSHQRMNSRFTEWFKIINSAIRLALDPNAENFDADLATAKANMDSQVFKLFEDVSDLVLTLLISRTGLEKSQLSDTRQQVLRIAEQAFTNVELYDQVIIDSIQILHDQVLDGPVGRQTEYTARCNIIKQKMETGNSYVDPNIDLWYLLLDICTALPTFQNTTTFRFGIA